jgi:hypothetical protein
VGIGYLAKIGKNVRSERSWRKRSNPKDAGKKMMKI